MAEIVDNLRFVVTINRSLKKNISIVKKVTKNLTVVRAIRDKVKV